jgi:hypothetical protein
MLNRPQERELEKVNAFYLQKEAEVSPIHLRLVDVRRLTSHSSKFG